jgi:hypothetical protein
VLESERWAATTANSTSETEQADICAQHAACQDTLSETHTTSKVGKVGRAFARAVFLSLALTMIRPPARMLRHQCRRR